MKNLTLFINLILLCLFTIIVACKSGNNKNSAKASNFNKSKCDSATTLAQIDYEKNKLKYYYQSIAAPNPKLSNFLRDSCKITVISKNDIASSVNNCYNNFTESIIRKKTGKTLSQLIKQQL